MAEELLPEEGAENTEDNQQHEGGERHHRRRRRVRRRIRIKKKSSPKKKIKKLAEKVIWAIIIIGFIATLVIMVRQLNIVDEKNKKTKSSSMNSFPVPVIKNS
jgi:hypothetical protein